MNSEIYSPFNLGSDLARLARPQNVIYPGLLSALSCYFVTNSVFNSVLCYLYFAVVYAIAATHNNISDIRTDELNHRVDNPLVAGRLSLHIAKIFIFVNLTVFLVLQVGLVQPISLGLGVIVLFLAFAYSALGIKSKGWQAPLLLSICYGVIPLLLGVGQGTTLPISLTMYMVIAQVLLLYPILLAKDYKDIRGDKMTGKKTLLVKYGPVFVRRLTSGILPITAAYVAVLALVLDGLLLIAPLLFIYTFLVIFTHHNKGIIPSFINKLSMLNILAISLVLLNFSLRV